MKSLDCFGYDRSQLIPLYLCSDGCYRRADQIPGFKSTAVSMDAKPVATDNGISDDDYRLIRQAIASVSRKPVSRKPVANDSLTRDEHLMLQRAMKDVKPIDRRRVSTAQDEEVRYFTTNDPGATLQAPLKWKPYAYTQDGE